jgi:hypothetical protein
MVHATILRTSKRNVLDIISTDGLGKSHVWTLQGSYSYTGILMLASSYFDTFM